MIVRVGDHSFELKNPDAAPFLRALSEHEGHWVSGPEIMRDYIEKRRPTIRFDRIRRTLEEPIRNLIESSSKGYRLSRPESSL
jgi:hypothetical protein